MKFKIKKRNLWLFLLICLAGFLRLYNLNWDQGYFLHPDERLFVNASNISLPQNINDFWKPSSPLNPHMFYYGAFPLYLYKTVNILITPFLSFLLTGRLISATMSILTVILIFLLGRTVFSEKAAFYAAFVFAFTTGSIQYAHFQTTESLLTFLVTIITFLSIKWLQKPSPRITIVLGVLLGISYATKITGLAFLLIILPAFAAYFLREKNWQKILLHIALLTTFALSTGFLAAPYQIIDYANFSKEQTYMQAVVVGKYQAPFTLIYTGTLPYIYQILNVFPFILGFITFPLSVLGFGALCRRLITKRLISDLILILFPLIYFLVAGSWFAKFSRYYLPLLPFLTLYAAFYLARVKKRFAFLFLTLICLNGLLFFTIYLTPNTRIAASDWIRQNLDTSSRIMTEYWDDKLPLEKAQDKQYLLSKPFDMYSPDTKQKISNLAKRLSQTDYFILSSRRVYQSILNDEKNYPLTYEFYKLLFAKKLGFQEIKSFTKNPFFFSDNFADESFQSYDHPPVMIFQNVSYLAPLTLERLILLNKKAKTSFHFPL